MELTVPLKQALSKMRDGRQEEKGYKPAVTRETSEKWRDVTRSDLKREWMWWIGLRIEESSRKERGLSSQEDVLVHVVT